MQMPASELLDKLDSSSVEVIQNQRFSDNMAREMKTCPLHGNPQGEDVMAKLKDIMPEVNLQLAVNEPKFDALTTTIDHKLEIS